MRAAWRSAVRAVTTGAAARRFRGLYGESPLHLLILLLSFVVCGYAAARLLEGDWPAIVGWFVGAALLHDLVLVPLYGGADWLLHRVLRPRRPAAGTGSATDADAETDAETGGQAGPRISVANHVRVPACLSLLALLVYWPLISQGRRRYFLLATDLTPDAFLPRWLLTTAALFIASAVVFALRHWRVRSVRRRNGPAADPSRR